MGYHKAIEMLTKRWRGEEEEEPLKKFCEVGGEPREDGIIKANKLKFLRLREW